jgi:glycosyltransferase involved in cell wall biosynthesis
LRTILYFNLYAELGGAENALLHLLASLDRTRFRPLVALASDGPLGARLAEAGVEHRVIPFPARALWNLPLPWVFVRYLRAARELSALVEERSVDILHTGDVLCLLIARLAGLQRPVLYQLNYSGSWPRRALLRVLARRGVAHVVAFSEAQREVLGREAPELLGRCSVVPAGIETPEADTSRSAMRLRLGLAEAAPFVAMFARFDAMKGHETFLRAAALVRAHRTDVAFAIVGGPLNAGLLPHVSRVEARVIALRHELGLDDVLRLAGFVPDPANWMAACDVVVCPSVAEPFGLVVVEAMSLGAAVLVADSGGPAEIVENGKSGLHFRTGEPASLAEGLIRLLADDGLRRGLAEAGRKRVAMRYHRTAFARSLETLYASLA